MAWAEVGSGSQRATQAGGNAASWTKAYPANVAAGSLLVGGGAAWRSGATGLLPVNVSDTRGTTYSVIYTTPIAAFSGKLTNFIFYGIAPSSGANTVQVDQADTVASYFGFAIDEFSGISASPLAATGADAAVLTAVVGGSSIAWTLGAARTNVEKAVQFAASGGGVSLLVGIMSYVFPNTTIAVTAPATQIGEEEDNNTHQAFNLAFGNGDSVGGGSQFPALTVAP